MQQETQVVPFPIAHVPRAHPRQHYHTEEVWVLSLRRFAAWFAGERRKVSSPPWIQPPAEYPELCKEVHEDIKKLLAEYGPVEVVLKVENFSYCRQEKVAVVTFNGKIIRVPRYCLKQLMDYGALTIFTRRQLVA